MNKIIKTGNVYRVASEESMLTLDNLPAQNYTVKFNNMAGEYYLESIDPFKLPNKFYGSLQKDANRIIKTFQSRPNVTGVLLEGSKGSGKTLLAKYVAQVGLTFGMPTVVINQPFYGDVFNQFIQGLGDNVIVIFDEFEKVYDSKEQEKVLTLLDGVFPSKKLYFLTVNAMRRVDSHLLNRPGRVYYRLTYYNLDSEFIREYCEDNLVDKSQIDDIITHAKIFASFNFDMLQAAVEEMNRYDESFLEVTQVLNVDPEDTNNFMPYEVAVALPGHAPLPYGPPRNIDIRDPDMHISLNELNIANPSEEMKKEMEEYRHVRVRGEDLVEVDLENDTFIYGINCGAIPVKVIVKRQDPFNMKTTALDVALGYDCAPTLKEKGASENNKVKALSEALDSLPIGRKFKWN